MLLGGEEESQRRLSNVVHGDVIVCQVCYTFRVLDEIDLGLWLKWVENLELRIRFV